MSTLKVNTIADPDNGNTAITIDSSGNATFSGNVSVTGTLPAAQLTGTLPAIDGSALTGLTTPVTGNSLFIAYDTTLGWATLSDQATVEFGATRYNVDGDYSTSTHKFTAPSDGIYQFFAHIYSFNSDETNQFEYVKNSLDFSYTYNGTPRYMLGGVASEDNYINMNLLVELSQNDTIHIRSVGTSDYYRQASYFFGYRVK